MFFMNSKVDVLCHITIVFAGEIRKKVTDSIQWLNINNIVYVIH